MRGSANHWIGSRKVRLVACVFSLVLALPGCMIPKLRQAETGLVVPPDYIGASHSENSAQLRVDEFYNDETLTRLVCSAVANNRELRVLDQEVQVARYDIMRRRGTFFPFLSMAALGGVDHTSQFTDEGVSRQDDPYVQGANPKFLTNPLASTMLGLNIFWQLDIWRELRNARDAAVQRYFAAIDKRNYFVTKLVADVAENYYELMALDNRLVNLDAIIAFQQRSLEVTEANRLAGRDSALPVQRFQAEVRKNQSEKLIVYQEIIRVENKINTLAGRFPQRIKRDSSVFLNLRLGSLKVGVPSQILLNRLDIRKAEREVTASGLDVKVARAHFFPKFGVTAGFGYSAFNPKYLFMTPQAMIAGAAGQLTAPLLNKAAIRADYLTASAKQLEAIYNYQQVIIVAFTEVATQLAKMEYYTSSIQLKRQQLTALESAVASATSLYQKPRLAEKGRVDYLDVLTSQRDLLEARMVLITTKQAQLASIVNAYRALGGGSAVSCPPVDPNQVASQDPQTLIVPKVEDLRVPIQKQLPVPRQVDVAPKPRPLPVIPKPGVPEPKPGVPEPKPMEKGKDSGPIAMAPTRIEWVRVHPRMLPAQVNTID